MKGHKKAFVILSLSLFLTSFSLAWAKPSYLEFNSRQREEFKNLIEKSGEGFSKYLKSKEDFNSTKEKLRQMNDERVRALVQERAKLFLENMIEARILHLKALRKRVEVAKKIREEDRNRILSQIDAQIKWFEDKKNEVSQIKNQEDIKKIAQEMKSYLNQNRAFMKKIIGQILVARSNWVVEKFEETSKNLSQKINDLKNQGKDVSGLETKLNDFNNKIEEAKNKLQQAQSSFDKIETNQDAKSVFQEGMKSFKEAHQLLREVHKILVEIKVGINKLSGVEDQETNQ